MRSKKLTLDRFLSFGEEDVRDHVRQRKAETLHESGTSHGIGICYLLSVTYDGRKGRALLKLYDPEREVIYLWHDNTGHKPYLLTNLDINEINRIQK